MVKWLSSFSLLFTFSSLFTFLSLFTYSSTASSNALADDSSATQNEIVPNIAHVMQKEASTLLADKRFTSTSIGVVYGQSSEIGHFGELTRNQANKPSNNTLYEIGSVSKTMVGLLVADAEKKGLISLEANINRYLGDTLSKVSPENNPMTVKQLLTHTSGLPNSYEDLGITTQELNRTRFLAEVNQADTAVRKGKFTYSSVGTELLSHLLETVYQQPFDELLAQFLSEQLGMENTRVNLSTQQLSNLAYGYNSEQQVAVAHTEQNRLWGGSGYIKSSMTDLTAYMRFQLQTSNELVQLSHQKLYDVSKFDGMGYLWIVSNDKTLGQYFIHHGGVESTQNWMMIFPEHKMAISVVTNASFPETAGILRGVGMRIAESLVKS